MFRSLLEGNERGNSECNGCRADVQPRHLDPCGNIAPLKKIEFGFGYILIRSPYVPYFIYLRGSIVYYNVLYNTTVYYILSA